MGITLQDLIQPLDVDTFVRDCFLAGRHHLSRLCDTGLAELAAIPELQSIDRLLATAVRAHVFGADGNPTPCTNETARAFYDRGHVLYMNGVHAAVPAAWELVESICATFGIHPRYVRLEVFAGRAGAVSLMHYDHEFNFHVLMRGSKRWHVESNVHIDNPLEPYHVRMAPKDELFAKALPLPRTFSSPDVLDMQPGSCLFFPAGHWHQVESLEETFAIGITLDPPRVHQVLAKALENLLSWTSRHRWGAFGLLGDGSPPVLQAHTMAAFEDARRAGLALLEAIRPEDASVAREVGRFRWSPQHADRRLSPASLADDGLVLDERFDALIERLALVEGSFDLRQLCAWAPAVAGEEMLAVVLELIARGVFEQDPS